MPSKKSKVILLVGSHKKHVEKQEIELVYLTNQQWFMQKF